MYLLHRLTFSMTLNERLTAKKVSFTNSLLLSTATMSGSLNDAARAKDILDIVPSAMRTLRHELRSHAKTDLTVPQFRILIRLDESPATNRDIAEWMGVTAPTASRMIDALLRREFVTRAYDAPTDARKVTVRLTPKGEACLANIRNEVQSQMIDRLASLPERKKRALSSGLAVLSELFPRQSRRPE